MRSMELEKHLMEEYFLRKLPERLHEHERLELLLLVTGEKPGALVMSPDNGDRELLEEFCEEFDLSYLHSGGEERSFFDRLLGRDTRFLKGGFFVAREEDSLEELQDSEGKFYGFSDRAVGEFLGYPEEAVEYFIKRKKENHISIRTENVLEELVEEGELEEEDSKYLQLVSYVPHPTKKCVLDAVEKGKKREKALRELDEQLETRIGRRCIREVLQTAPATHNSGNA